MKHDNFKAVESYFPLPPEKLQKLTVTIGNYAKIKFRPTEIPNIYDQSIIAEITPLPDALVQFEPHVSVLLLAESIHGSLEYPRSIIPYLKDIRDALIEKQYIPSPAFNTYFE